MESVEVLTRENFTPAEWLNFYRNVWNRNCIARTIDIQTDLLLLEERPNEVIKNDADAVISICNAFMNGRIDKKTLVDMLNKQYVSVAERVEMRKIALADGLSILKATSELGKVDLQEKFWSSKALEVSPEMTHMVTDFVENEEALEQANKVYAAATEEATEPAVVTEVQEALAEVVEAVQDAAQAPVQDAPVAVEATPDTQA